MSFITSLFSAPKASAPVLMPMPVSPASSEAKAQAEEAAQKQRQAAALAKGRASTLLSSGEGVPGQAPVRLKKLFGE